MKTLRVLCIGHQGVLVKKPFSEALATLLVIAKLTCDGIATRKDSVQIFMLRSEEPLPERVISLAKKDEGVKAYAVDEYEICLVCKGRAMIDLLSGIHKTELKIRIMSAADFLRSSKKKETERIVEQV